jgi:hypothetical protein
MPAMTDDAPFALRISCLMNLFMRVARVVSGYEDTSYDRSTQFRRRVESINENR